MTSFATASDLATRLGLTLISPEATRAMDLLATATGLIQDATGQTITLVEDDELVRDGTRDRDFWLPQRPVISVASISVNDVELDPESWFLEGNRVVAKRWRWSTGIGPGQDGTSWLFGRPFDQLTVVYTHGYEEIPQTVKSICMEAAVRVWVNPGSVIQEGIAGVNVVYAPYQAPPAGLALTPTERKTLRRMFSVTARSVNVE